MIASASLWNIAADSKSNDAEWTLYFWKEKTRGNFVRLVLEQCNVKYNDIYEYNQIREKFVSPTFSNGKYAGNYDNFNENRFQPFAPPLLLKPDDGNFMLSQTIVIVSYLSTLYKLCPRSIDNKYKSLMIVQNAIDCFEEMVRFGTMMRYYDNKYNQEINKKRLIYWFKNRLPTWLDIFCKPLDDNNNIYYFENKITESDLALFNVLDGIREFIGDDLFNEYIFDNPKYSNLKKHYQNMLSSSSGIKKLYQRQDENNFDWWIYDHNNSKDFLGIDRCRTFLKQSLSNY